MRKTAITFALLLLLIGVGFALADPAGVDNSASNPDTTGFNYYYIPQMITGNNSLINYADPQMLFKVHIENTLTQPNLLVDSSGNLFDTYNFADLGAVQTTINGETHYVLTVNTTANTTTQPTGVTESKSGVYHYGSITLPDGMVIKFWVVDTQTAGVYDKVFIDLNADLIIDYTNLGEQSYFTITDELGGKMMVVINKIDSNGTYVQIYNDYDNLVAGQTSPIDGTPLQPVKKPHWITLGIQTQSIANVNSVDFYVPDGNGGMREIEPQDFVIGNFDPSTKAITITALLGDYSYNGNYIPAVREIYALAHLAPVTYDAVKTVDTDTNTTVVTITFHNKAGIQLGAGYIKVTNVAPADAIYSITKTLEVETSGVTVTPVQGINGVDLVFNFNSLPVGDTVVTIKYKYVNGVIDKLNEVENKVDDLQNKTNTLYNVTVNDVAKNIEKLIEDNAQELSVLNQLANQSVTVDLTPLENQLDTISKSLNDQSNAISSMNDNLGQLQSTVQNIQQQLTALSTQVQNLQSTMANAIPNFDVKTMNQITIDEINKLIANIQNSINEMNAMLGGNSVAQNVSEQTSGNALDEDTTQYIQGILTQLQTMLTNLQTIKAQVSKFDDSTSPFIVLMYYEKVLLYENQYDNLVMDYNKILLNNVISGKIDGVNNKMTALLQQMTTMQNSIATTVNAVPTRVQNTITQTLTPLSKDIAMIKNLLLITILLVTVVLYFAWKGGKGGKEEGAPEAGMPVGGMPGAPMGGNEMGMMPNQMTGAPGQMPGQAPNQFGGQGFGQGNFGEGFGLPEQQ